MSSTNLPDDEQMSWTWSEKANLPTYRYISGEEGDE